MKTNGAQLMEDLRREYLQQIDQAKILRGKAAADLPSVRIFDYRRRFFQDLDAAHDAFTKHFRREPTFSELRDAFAKKEYEKIRQRICIEIPSGIRTTAEFKNTVKDIYDLLSPRLHQARFREKELKRYLWVYRKKKNNIRYVDILDEYRQEFGFLNNDENDVISKMSLDLKRAKKIIENIKNNVPAWWYG